MESWQVEKLVPIGLYLCNCLYIKLRVASLDVRIAHVHGVGVAVHNQFDTHTPVFNSVSHISSSQ